MRTLVDDACRCLVSEVRVIVWMVAGVQSALAASRLLHWLLAVDCARVLERQRVRGEFDCSLVEVPGSTVTEVCQHVCCR